MDFRSAVNWGVIGCGQIALDKSLPGLLAAPSARLIAISDPLESRRALALELAGQHGETPQAYEEYDSLLSNPDVDAVYIALPTGMHVEAVKAATNAGKAILCEKPLGRSAEETRIMIRAARNANVPLMAAYMSRFSDVFQEGARLLREGTIGQVTSVVAHFSYFALYKIGAPGGWRWIEAEGGGPLLDIGVYLAFGLREMLGEPIVKVRAMECNTVAPDGATINDTLTAWFQTESGIPGSFITAFSHNECRISVYGTKGSLQVKHLFGQGPEGHLECHAENFHHVLDQYKTELPHYENYRREIEHFSSSLLGHTAYHPSPEEVLSDALLLDALRDSSQNNDVVNIPSANEYLESQ